VALDKSDGRVIWQSQAFKPAYASPVPMQLGDRTCIVSLNTQGIAVLDAADGSTLAFTKWETRFDTNATTPIIAGDRIFMSTGYDRGCALFRFTGSSLEKLYENKSMSNHMAACVLIDGHLYGFNGNSHQSRNVQLVCMELASGQVKWSQRGLGCGSLMAADGKLIVLGSEGELVVAPATPAGFQPAARMQVFDGRARCWTQPVLANGRVYCRAADGRVVCVDVSGE
jgi:outer membrane protein assembly factor BamB